MFSTARHCRICGNPNLVEILDLGMQMLTGVFPPEKTTSVTSGPLRLVRCDGAVGKVCGLVQLGESYDLTELYGGNYGYRSGLNPSMVAHLQAKVDRICALTSLHAGDLVVDIGSNDGTTLRAYPDIGLVLAGIDPTGERFRSFFPERAHLIPDFFSAGRIKRAFPGKRARVVTSFSMFYDLERPLDFMREVHDILADDGIWIFEQSYMPTMLEMNSYDTVCHEHLEYYALRQVKWMADRVGFRIVDLEFNEVNGGSFSVTVAKNASGLVQHPEVARTLDRELALGLDTPKPYEEFARRVAESRRELLEFVDQARREGRTVAAIGASTKGNVLLQFCGLGPTQITAVGEVNPEKFGCYTPGTWIPIVPEAEVLKAEPDYLLVLPWHFREFFLKNAAFAGRCLLFPLPKMERIGGGDPATNPS